MNEEHKSIWKKSFRGRTALVLWLAVTLFAIMLGNFIVALINCDRPLSDWCRSAGILTGVILTACLLSIYVFWPLLRWLIRKHWQRSLFALACLATLVALFYAEEDWRGWHAWHQFKQQWEAKGEHFDLASLVPPPVPEEQNFAMTPIVFTSYGQLLTRDGKEIPSQQRPTNFVVRMSMELADNYNDPTNGWGDRTRGTFTSLEAWQSYYRELASKTNEFPVPAQPGSPAADVLLALSKYDPVIAELRAASQLPAARYPLTYDHESPAMILLPHLAPLKQCARVLSLRSVAELQNGQPEKALDDVRLGLQLADKIRTEPFLISHLVRIAMVQIMLQPIWEGLAEHKWSNPQLAALNAELAKLDFPAVYQLSIRSEMACQNREMERLRQHPERLDDLQGFRDGDGNNSEPRLPGGLLARLIPAGWFYQNQYRAGNTMMNYYLPVANVAQGTFSPELARHGDAAVAAEVKSPSPFNMLERMVLPALGNAAKKFAYGQASADLARTAIALERYRLARGEFPEALDALGPQFIAQVPHDVMGGQPLKYRREADGRFVLYSIGWNGTDDGGVVVFKKGAKPSVDLDQGDWVWRYPPR